MPPVAVERRERRGWPGNRQPAAALARSVRIPRRRIHPDAGPPLTYPSLNQILQVALAAALGGAQIPAALRLVVSGHMHLFQFLAFTDSDAGARPPQLVIGNSSVALYDNGPEGVFEGIVDGAPAAGLGNFRHGYLDVTALAPDGAWSGGLVDPQTSVPLAVCDTANLPAPLCVPGGSE